MMNQIRANDDSLMCGINESLCAPYCWSVTNACSCDYKLMWWNNREVMLQLMGSLLHQIVQICIILHLLSLLIVNCGYYKLYLTNDI